MKKILGVLILVVILLVPTYCFADTSSDEEMVSVPKSSLTNEQKAQIATEKASSWVGLGKEIGEAVDSSLSALTDNADKFANTKVGMFTMFIVAYKVVGTDAIQFLIGIPLFVFLLICWIIAFNKIAMPKRRLLTKEGNILFSKKTYDPKVEYVDSDVLWGFALVLVAVIGICALIIFA